MPLIILGATAMSDPTDIHKKSPDFTTTNWSMVLAAGSDNISSATFALERLCRRYWHPIYAFVRRRGFDPHQSEDLTQSFFAYLLDKEMVKKASRKKGKFRSFLLAALTNFLANEWDKAQTLKRGSQCTFVSLDETAADEIYFRDSIDTLTPEKLFERRWALTLVEQTLVRLKEEYAGNGREKIFTELEPGLTGESAGGQYAKWALALDMNEGAVKVALHRLRRRFGELLRSEIAHTVASPSEVDEELRHLFAAISL